MLRSGRPSPRLLLLVMLAGGVSAQTAFHESAIPTGYQTGLVAWDAGLLNGDDRPDLLLVPGWA